MTTSGGPLIGSQKRAVWMGDPILTLADIWPDETRAMIVGLNPAPKSVEIGHDYQGASGRRQLLRLTKAGLLYSPAPDTYFEESALASGVGWTDPVKRPTRGRGTCRARNSHSAGVRSSRCYAGTRCRWLSASSGSLLTPSWVARASSDSGQSRRRGAGRCFARPDRSSGPTALVQ
ncbi:hypothetical protein DBR36_00940 [Microbacterium sp. HMWF026]|nr:hypothetical protein DBR36_00940 [Microbacterium sp. HMWF026]